MHSWIRAQAVEFGARIARRGRIVHVGLTTTADLLGLVALTLGVFGYHGVAFVIELVSELLRVAAAEAVRNHIARGSVGAVRAGRKAGVSVRQAIRTASRWLGGHLHR
ncbi:hypothetical protein [Nocardia nova]|uniref:hypothetical protein n=1 Tax=Nocardia nova TaxID=37330 RepID=UPI0007A4EA33|nr:hypothetical protein [Nocardia nova]